MFAEPGTLLQSTDMKHNAQGLIGRVLKLMVAVFALQHLLRGNSSMIEIRRSVKTI
jgi:hypothetical protein